MEQEKRLISPIPRTSIDPQAETVTLHHADGDEVLAMNSAAGFQAASRAWLRCGWDVKQVYSFTWMGRPIIQLPEDLIRCQEVIYQLQPDLLIETGVAHGGSLIFYASLLALIGHGRVIGVDVEIRSHNRAALQAHPLASWIRLIEGSSIDPEILAQLHMQIQPSDHTILVILDANHSRDHVRAELEAYGPLVTPGSYIVACDGIMPDMVGAPRTKSDWARDNPLAAIDDFLAAHPEFSSHEPEFAFNEGQVTQRVTYWPRAFLRRNPL